MMMMMMMMMLLLLPLLLLLVMMMFTMNMLKIRTRKWTPKRWEVFRCSKEFEHLVGDSHCPGTWTTAGWQWGATGEFDARNPKSPIRLCPICWVSLVSELVCSFFKRSYPTFQVDSTGSELLDVRRVSRFFNAASRWKNWFAWTCATSWYAGAPMESSWFVPERWGPQGRFQHISIHGWMIHSYIGHISVI